MLKQLSAVQHAYVEVRQPSATKAESEAIAETLKPTWKEREHLMQWACNAAQEFARDGAFAAGANSGAARCDGLQIMEDLQRRLTKWRARAAEATSPHRLHQHRREDADLRLDA